jgi:hypothetical protein
VPSFAAATTIAHSADYVFAALSDGTTLARWGGPPAEHRLCVDHLGGPRSGEGAAFRVLERLRNGALANYEVTVAGCERPSTVALLAPRAFDRAFTCEAIGETATRVLEVRTYPDDPRSLVARLFAADLDRQPVEDEIRGELERLGALLAGTKPRIAGTAALVSG